MNAIGIKHLETMRRCARTNSQAHQYRRFDALTVLVTLGALRFMFGFSIVRSLRWLCVFVCLGAASAIVYDAVMPTRNRGFRAERFTATGDNCHGALGGTREAVREPVITRTTASYCYRFTSNFVARRRSDLVLFVDTNDAFVLSVDGQSWTRGHGASSGDRTFQHDLAVGLHSVTLETANPVGQHGYLRLQQLDQRERRLWATRPIDLDEWQIDGRAEPSSRRGAARYLAFLALLVVAAAAAPTRRPRRPDASTIAALTVFGGSFAYLLPYAISVGVSFDELAYVKAGEHYFASAIAGDFSSAGFRWNMEHVPLSKWVFGFGALIGGFEGARVQAALAGALALSFITKAGAALGTPRTGLLAAGLLLTTPHFVGLAHTCTLDVLVACVYAAQLWVMSVLARPYGSLEIGTVPPRETKTVLVAILPMLFVLGFGMRATAIWSLVPSIYVLWLQLRTKPKRWALPFASGLIGAACLFALWPWLWPDPIDQFRQSFSHFAGYRPQEVYLGTMQRLPWHYFAHAFVATTPELHVLLAGSSVLVFRKGQRALLGFLLLAVLTPFVQSASHVRQDLARYVVSAWPALALLGAISLELGWRRVAFSIPQVRWVAIGLTAVALLSAGIGLRMHEPYPRTYFAPWTGGLREVARTRMFEIADWCEGMTDATNWINNHADAGQHVRFDGACRDLHGRLRDDLEEGGAPAFVVRHAIAYEMGRVSEHCEIVHEIQVQGVTIARVEFCDN